MHRDSGRLVIDVAAWRSPWRHRSVAEKALLCLGLLTIALLSRSLIVAAAVLGCVVALATVGARVPIGVLLRALAMPMAFIGVGLLSIAISLGSPAPDAIWAWGPLSTSAPSIDLALHTGGRSLAAMSAVLLLALTTPMTDLLASLRIIKVPEVLVEIAAVIYRMLFTLLRSQATVREAQAARLGFATSRTAITTTGLMFSAVFIRAWTSAQRLEVGLAGRGYTGALTVTHPPREVSRSFIARTLALLAALVLLIALAPQ